MRSISERAEIPAIAAVLFVVVFAAANATYAGTFQDSQNFATLSQATSAGFSGLNNQTLLQNYGFSNTPNASGVAGEAGGSFRLEASRTYYADLTLNGTLNSGTDAVSAGGKIAITNSATGGSQVFIAHFNSANTLNQNIFGMRISDNNGSSTSVRMQAWAFYGGGSDNGALVTVPNTVTDFSYEFDPDPDNNPFTTGGLLTAILTDGVTNYTSSTTTSASLTGSFDAWGLRTDALGGQEFQNPLTFFIDNVNYTSIPEPASAGMIALGAALRFGRRNRR